MSKSAIPNLRLPVGVFLLVLASLVLTGCLGSANRPLQLLSGAGPVYPPEARAQGIEGDVTVRYAISADGQVQQAEVVAAEPAGIFEAAALAAVRSWRYAAPVRDGQPQAVAQVRSVVRFRLDQSLDYLEDE